MAALLGRVLWRLGLIVGVGLFVFAWWASTTVPIHSGRASLEDVVLGAIVGIALIVIGCYVDTPCLGRRRYKLQNGALRNWTWFSRRRHASIAARGRSVTQTCATDNDYFHTGAQFHHY